MDIDKDDDAIKCPECRQLSRIPQGGIPQLRTNLRLRNLAEKHASYESFKIHQSHEEHEEVRPVRNEECPRHEKEHLLFYCVSCDISICQHCLVPAHLNHNVQEREAVSHQLEHRNQESPTHTLEEEHDKITKCVRNHVEQIQKEGRILREQLQKYEAEVEQTYLQVIESDKQTLKSKLEMLAAIQKSVDNDDDYDILANYKTIMMQIEELDEQQPVFSLGIDKPNVPRFIPKPPSERNLGKIVVRSNKHGIDGDSYERSLPSTHVIDDGTYETPQIRTTVTPRSKAPLPPIPRSRSRSLETDALPTEVARKKAPPLPRRRRLESSPALPVSESRSPTTATPFNTEESITRNRISEADEHVLTDHADRQDKVELQLVNEFGDFTDAVSVATGGDVIAVCDRKLQTSVWKREGGVYKGVSFLKSAQPNDVAVTYDGTTIIVANGKNAEMFSIDNYNCKTIIHTVKDTQDSRKSRKGLDIQSVLVMPDKSFLLGDIERHVVTQHNATGALLMTMPIKIKPYSMTALDHQRFAVSDHERGVVLVRDICADDDTDPRKNVRDRSRFKCFPIKHVYGLCYNPNSFLFIAERRFGRKGTIALYSLDGEM